MRLAPVFVLLLVASALAGCSGSAPADGGTQTEADEGGTATGTDGNATDENALEPVPQPVSLHFTPDGELVEGLAENGSVGLPEFMSQNAAGAQGYAAFATPVADHGRFVAPQEVTVTLFIEVDAPVAGNQVFDIAAWFGTSRQMGLFGFTSLGPLMPGTHEVTLSLPFDGGDSDYRGFAVPAGDSVQTWVASSLLSDGSTVRLLTGGETDSRAELVWQNLTPDPVAPAVSTSSETFTGTVQGGTFAECQESETGHEFTVDANATYVELLLSAPSTSGAEDIDPNLYHQGTRIAHGGEPGTEDGIFLAGPALDGLRGQTLEARVAICLGGSVDYEITVDQGSA